LPGEDKKGVFGAVEFVEILRQNHHQTHVEKRVMVLGGGNTAMDAASECARMGAEEVFLVYRRSREDMGAYDFEYDLAKSVGVKGLFNLSPVEITGNERVEGIKFVKTETKNGKPEAIPSSEFELPCDWVVKATGQSKQKHLLDMIDGLDFDASGKILVNENGRTSHPKYYAAGDAVSGGQEVVNAVANGKKAARAIAATLV
jgi:glutamate synthase (NADPH/NADH) small chain